MQSQININIAVDVIKALSVNSLVGNIYMMDDSILESTGQGTERLCTFCNPGQIIRWTVYALDLQTPVAIRNISFSGDVKNEMQDIDPDINEWTGILPIMEKGRKYYYRLELQIGVGYYGCLAIYTPSLLYAGPPLCRTNSLVNLKNK